MAKLRKIIHVDMDAFFASVEQRDNPQLKGRPIAVGHPDQRGVVAAASYEARRYGVRSAMPSSRAAKLCPGLIFVTPRFDAYKNVSAQMHGIFHEYTDIVEPISLDEAFLDVTDNKMGIPLAVTIAREIKQKIRERLELTASAGVSYNKFLAKIASDFRKPDGMFSIHPSSALKLIERLPIEAFWGIGPVTARKMHSMGIHNGADLRAMSFESLRAQFGKAGGVYYKFARGEDDRPVEAVRVRKSVGCEVTFDTDMTLKTQLYDRLRELAVDLYGRLQRADFRGCTLTVKLKYDDFSQITRSHTGERSSWDVVSLTDTARMIIDNLGTLARPVRLMGITVSNPPEREPSRHSSFSMLNDDWRQLLIDFDTDY
ncbi:MAG: DNA polymerase IV [Muribaculaceae bacterium]|nr:DNA polymerase IV [Muribaculaceae bacterium]